MRTSHTSLSLSWNSSIVRHNLWSCNNNYPTNDIGHSQIPWYAEQCTWVHEIARGTESAKRTSDGLRSLNVGNDQRTRYRQGLFVRIHQSDTFPAVHEEYVRAAHIVQAIDLLFVCYVCVGVYGKPIGAHLLSEGHESRYLCSSQSESVQRTSSIPVSFRRLPTSIGNAFYDVTLGARRFALPHGREYR